MYRSNLATALLATCVLGITAMHAFASTGPTVFVIRDPNTMLSETSTQLDTRRAPSVAVFASADGSGARLFSGSAEILDFCLKHPWRCLPW
jgi:hypothetical protein